MTYFDRTKEYFKITSKDENHKGYQYKDGLNILDKKFEPDGSCVAGGLYFTDKHSLCEYYDYGVWIREVFVPHNAQVVEDVVKYVVNDEFGDFKYPRKWRADKLVFGEKYKLYSLDTLKKFPWLNNDEFYSMKLLNSLAAEGNVKSLEELLKNPIKGLTVKNIYDKVRYEGLHVNLDSIFIKNNSKRTKRPVKLFNNDIIGLLYDAFMDKELDSAHELAQEDELFDEDCLLRPRVCPKKGCGNCPMKSSSGGCPMKAHGGKCSMKSSSGKCPMKSSGGKCPMKHHNGKCPLKFKKTVSSTQQIPQYKYNRSKYGRSKYVPVKHVPSYRWFNGRWVEEWY
jgi:hypothetical protein